MSAAGEDGDELSAAGQMDTVLGVRSTQQLHDAVRKCWSSYFALPAVTYRHQHGQPLYEPRLRIAGDIDEDTRGGVISGSGALSVGMGVVIQQLVPADTSGTNHVRFELHAVCACFWLFRSPLILAMLTAAELGNY